uniref:phytanoyl-CoA dioxygenase family protein n=1 Tax=Salinibacterium sp. TaxID=1915057 RepID=UPI00286CD79E
VLRDRLRQDGYLYLTGHLDPWVVMSFREFYFTKMAETGLLDSRQAPMEGIGAPGAIDRSKIREILYGDIVPGPEYEALTTQPEIRDWFEWFFDEPVHLHRRKIIRHIRPGEDGIGTATQAHYDLLYLRGGSDDVLSMWIPLGDCSVEMGGLTYLEGSHHWTMADEDEHVMYRPAGWMTANLPSLADTHDSRWLLANYKAGDVVVHSSYIVHAGTDNVDPGNRLRLSTDIRYQRSSEEIDQRWQKDWHENDGL